MIHVNTILTILLVLILCVLIVIHFTSKKHRTQSSMTGGGMLISTNHNVATDISTLNTESQSAVNVETNEKHTLESASVDVLLTKFTASTTKKPSQTSFTASKNMSNDLDDISKHLLTFIPQSFPNTIVKKEVQNILSVDASNVSNHNPESLIDIQKYNLKSINENIQLIKTEFMTRSDEQEVIQNAKSVLSYKLKKTTTSTSEATLKQQYNNLLRQCVSASAVNIAINKQKYITFYGTDGGNTPFYVIGDIHGDLKSLLIELSKYQEVLKESPQCHLIFLGDYIDRGEESMKCLEIVMSLLLLAPSQIHVLRGNHEDSLIGLNNKDVYDHHILINDIRQKFSECCSGNELLALYFAFCLFFSTLTPAVMIDNSLFVHGFLPKEFTNTTMNKKESIFNKRFPLQSSLMTTKGDAILEKFLWNDYPKELGRDRGRDVDDNTGYEELRNMSKLTNQRLKHIFKGHDHGGSQNDLTKSGISVHFIISSINILENYISGDHMNKYDQFEENSKNINRSKYAILPKDSYYFAHGVYYHDNLILKITDVGYRDNVFTKQINILFGALHY